VFEHLSQEQGLSYNTVTSFAQDKQGFLWIGTFDGLNRYDGVNFKVLRRPPNDTTTRIPKAIRLMYTMHNGDIWMADFTNALYRFNPASERFTKLPFSLSSNTDYAIGAFIEDAAGALWVSSTDGLHRYNPSTQSFSLVSVSVPVASAERWMAGMVECPSTSAPSAEHHLWIRKYGGLVEFDPQRGTFQHYNLTDTAQDRQFFFGGVARDSSGYLWFGDVAHVYCFDVQSKQVVARYPQEIYIRQSLFKNPPKNDFRLQSVFCAPDGTVWFGSFGGIVIIKYADHPRNATLRLLQHDEANPTSLSGNSVRTIFSDQSGVVWVGGEPFGINKYTPYKQKFLLFRHSSLSENSLGNNYVRGICQARDGTLWVATHFGGISRYQPHSRLGGIWTRFQDDLDNRIPHHLRLPINEVWAIFEDRDGVIWAGTRGKGLFRFNPAKQQFEQSSLVPQTAIVQVINEDRAGNLLVGLRGLVPYNSIYGKAYGDVFEIPRNRTKSGVRAYVTVQPAILGALSGDVLALHEDRAGTLWIGCSRRLLRLNRVTGALVDETQKFLKASGIMVSLVGSVASSIFEDHEGNVWVTSKGAGLGRYNPQTDSFQAVTQRDGLPNNSVYAALEDGHGNFWISSDAGLSLWDRTAKNRAVNTFRTFTTADGLQGREFNRRSFFKSANGMMFFGGTNGLNAFHPDSLRFNPFPPSVALASLKIFAEEVPIDSIISYPSYPNGIDRQQAQSEGILTLRHDQNFLTFQFAALDFHVPQNNAYAYILEGVDKAWIQNGTKREATYTNLSPGKYVLRVRAANNDGVWAASGRDLVLRIVILPPWWQTWWFRGVLLCLGVAALAAVLWSYQRRINLLQTHKQELMRHIEQRHRMEGELVNSEQKFRALFETSPLGMVLWEKSGRVLEANAAFAQIAGYAAHNITAHNATLNFWNMLSDAQNSAILYSLEQRNAFGPVEQTLTQPTGEKISVMLYGIVVNANDANTSRGSRSANNELRERIWTVLEDVTERKRAVDAMLRYQLNPHFMFNVLNSVNALMGENQRNAKRMIIQFSSLLRHTLVASSKQTAPLGDEIEAVGHYLAIEKLRFEERLEASIDADPATLGLNVPVFLVQPLVENAIKYGMQTSEGTLQLAITSRLQDDELCIEVSNSGAWIEFQQPHQIRSGSEVIPSEASTAGVQANGASIANTRRRSTGIGLDNLRKRLQQLYPGGHSLTISHEQGFVRVRIYIALRELVAAESALLVERPTDYSETTSISNTAYHDTKP
jgi:PAS domain S-box-containing protein